MNSNRVIHLIFRAAGGIRRKPWLHLLSVLTLTTAFLSFTASLTAALNLDKMIDRWIGSAELTVFLHEDTGNGELGKLADAISKLDGVSRVDAVSPKEAMKRFENQAGEIAASLPEQIFPPSLDVHLDAVASRNPETRSRLAARLGNVEMVESVELYDDWFHKLSALSLVGRLASWGLGFIALAVAVLVVTAVVKSGVTARAREIEVLKLVGATKSFVNAPFLMEGAFEALFAMALAVIGAHLLTQAATDFAGDFLTLLGGGELVRLPTTTSLVLLLGAAALGVIGARLSLRGQSSA